MICSEISWLAATPDSILVDENNRRIVLEIKCPKSNENGPINVNYIKDEKLKTSHPYFLQCQLQMLLCKCDLCILFIYSDVDHKIVYVEKDEKIL